MPADPHVTIRADRLIRARRIAGLTQEQLAFHAGTSGATISRWERSERKARRSSVDRLAKVLHVDAETLIET